MKAVFTFLVLIIFWLNAFSDNNVVGIQKPKDPAKQKTEAAPKDNIIQIDSVSNYSISVKGQSNSVQITNEPISLKSQEADSKRKITPNAISINGESNCVTINQNNSNGKVNINQNGNGNKINISQSIPNSEE